MQNYLDLLKTVLNTGETRKDRTGTGTLSVFGSKLSFNLEGGFPLLTTKKLHTKSIINELLWMLNGRTDNQWLLDRGVTIWNEWSDEEHCSKFGRKAGDLGPIYGHQWRNFGATLKADGTYNNDGVDQVQYIIDRINNKPHDRRILLSGWNPKELDLVDLPPCHTFCQFYVSENSKLSCQMYQRSADLFLGLPFDIASYAFFTSILAQVCNLKPKELTIVIGDTHIYLNHIEQVKTQLERIPRALPKLKLNPSIKKIEDFKFEDFEILDYNPYPSIKAAVSV